MKDLEVEVVKAMAELQALQTFDARALTQDLDCSSEQQARADELVANRIIFLKVFIRTSLERILLTWVFQR